MKLFFLNQYFSKYNLLSFIRKLGTGDLRIVFRHLAPYRKLFAAGLIFSAFFNLTSLCVPYLLKRLIDTIQQSGTTNALNELPPVIMTMMILLVTQATASFFEVYFFTLTGEHALMGLRTTIYNHVIQLPLEFFSQKRVGELSSRFNEDIAQLHQCGVTLIAGMLKGFMTVVLGIILIFYINYKLALLMLAILPIITLFSVFSGKLIRKMSFRARELWAMCNTIVHETLSGIANVKAFTSEHFEMKRYGDSLKKAETATIKNDHSRALFIAILNCFLYIAVLLLVFYSTFLIKSGELSFGDLTAFMIYNGMVAVGVSNVADVYSQVQKFAGAAIHINELLIQKAERVIALEGPIAEPLRLHGQIELKGVYFSYSSRPESVVLTNINLKIKAGQRIAIVGPSGSGKTSLGALLLRFYTPDRGQILFDEKDAATIPLSILRSQISLVSQDVFILGGTIRENIGYGKTGVTFSDIETAAKKAQAHEFICCLENGYDTIVGERGVKLSGGQRQRIAIARALIKDTVILILDEATSSLDANSEKYIQEALNTHFKGKTTFIIAHRLSTVKNSDCIIVLDQGTIREKGTHSELMAEYRSLYRSLHTLQT